ncbi:hypothetical protein Tco_0628425 [Tanacetum coccineum]|uniref:No apical meristem-associated C-terminal domain-containing protein n=1 Tax=Tanacetum coccineum TaxID=301880 RepID=A0ABQ4WQF0_9ASTR
MNSNPNNWINDFFYNLQNSSSSSNPTTPTSSNSHLPPRPTIQIPNPFSNFQVPNQNPFLNCTPEQFQFWLSQTQPTQQSQFPPHSSQPEPDGQTEAEAEADVEVEDEAPSRPSHKQNRKKSTAKKPTRDKQPKEPKTDRAFWSQEEEKLLAKCFIEISEDPKNRSDQARDTFWYKILTIYNQQADELGFKTRNKNMLKGKWTPMNRDVQKFNAIYNQTELLSGENEENLYTRVLTLFRDQNGVEFRHRDAWLFLKDKYKWTNPESTQARRTRGRVTGEDEPEMFGEDAIPRPSGAPRKSKSQRSSASSSATSGSSKNRLTEFFQEQIQLDREAKKESLDRELAARLAVVELQKRNEDLKILTFDTTGMNPEDAAKIEALKEKARATYFNF